MPFKDREKRQKYNREYKARQRREAQGTQEKSDKGDSFMNGLEAFCREGLALVGAVKEEQKKKDELERANRNLQIENEVLRQEQADLVRLIQEAKEAKGKFWPPNPLSPVQWERLLVLAHKGQVWGQMWSLAEVWDVPPYPPQAARLFLSDEERNKIALKRKAPECSQGVG